MKKEREPILNKKMNRKQKAPNRALRKRRVLLAVTLALSLLAGGVILARTELFQSATRQKKSKKQRAEVTAQGLLPGNPSKEYIYAGRLVATEEPAVTTLSAPSGLVATAASSTQVSLTWTASTGVVDHYQVERSQNFAAANNGFSTIAANVTTTSFSDTPVSGGTTYLYRVRAADASNTNFSAYSNTDLATTIIFFEEPLVAGVTTIKAQHVTELRQAVNAVRATANLTAAAWTDPSPLGVVVKAVHMNELRTNLDQALTTLGFTTQPYTDPTLVQGVTTVKAVHVQELRNRVK